MSPSSRRLRSRLRRRQRLHNRQRSGPWIAACCMLALLWVEIASFRFAPWWGIALYIAVLLAWSARLAHVARTDPARSLRVSLYAAGCWLVITAAGIVLGWWSA